MPPVGFEPTISAGERPQTYALDRAATGTGVFENARIRDDVGFPFTWRRLLSTAVATRYAAVGCMPGCPPE